MNNKALLLALLLALSGVDSFTINCEFYLQTSTPFGDIYECFTSNLPTAPANTTITAVTGTHEAGKTDADVTILYIDGDSTLPFMPRTSSVFPNLLAYIIANAVIGTLHGDEFNDIPQLLMLAVLDSNLTTISSRLFEATPNLIGVIFDNNPIERVGRDLFTPLNTTQLWLVVFVDSHCINQWSETQTGIAALIENLKVMCPFDDEEVPTTTTTEQPETCVDGDLEDFVCEMMSDTREDIEELRSANLRQEATIAVMKEEQQAISEEMRWMREELLRLTTNPCACK
jgi:hypothetical protein